jgi:hypothetical protein
VLTCCVISELSDCRRMSMTLLILRLGPWNAESGALGVGHVYELFGPAPAVLGKSSGKIDNYI